MNTGNDELVNVVNAKDVVILDDDDATRTALARVFRRFGYRTTPAWTNRDALAQVKKKAPALVTTDIFHPGDDGIAFLADVRRVVSPNLPVLVISGHLDDKTELAAWRAGASAVLSKPWPIQRLAEVTERLTRSGRAWEFELLDSPREDGSVDYKLEVSLDDKAGRAELARDVIGMANSGGGLIIVGVGQSGADFFRAGVTPSAAERLETTKVNNAISRYVGGTAFVTTRSVAHRGKNFLFLEVAPSKDTIALAITAHEGAGLHTGRIYVRSPDGSTHELKDPLSLQRLIARLVAHRRRQGQ